MFISNPCRDGEAFYTVTLPLVGEAGETTENWMKETESSLGLLRYPDGDEAMEGWLQKSKGSLQIQADSQHRLRVYAE